MASDLNSMNKPDRKRALSAILFADIKGYTGMMQSDESNAMKLLSRFKKCLREEVAKHKGSIIKIYGDGCICLFSSVLDAVTCAKDLQIRLLESPHVPLRIGVHVGDVVHADNDVFGDAINIASRIESMGIAGSVLLSKSVFDKIKNQPQLPAQSLGNFDFKNIDSALEIFALTNSGLVIPKRSELTKKAKPINTKSPITKKAIGTIAAIGLLLVAGYFTGKNIIQGISGDPESKEISKINKEEKSIAVLAFSDMSPEQDQAYFSEGISEEILNLLTRIPDLKVISRTSSFTFKDKEVTTEEIGRALKVNHILDGSIRKSGNTFRISTQLIEAQNGAQLWSQTYERSMDDIFKIQDEIASKIIEQLKVSLMGNSISSKKIDVEAYNLYLKAKSLRDEQNSESDRKAEEIIKSSIAIDSTYAPAWAMLSELIYNGAFSYSRYSIPEAIPLSKAAAQKSVTLDPNNALGYIALTTLNRAENDFVSADSNLNKALAIDPNNTDVIYESSSYALDLGLLDEAISQLKKAIRLDPLNSVLYYTLSIHYIWTEDYEAAEEAMKRYLDKNPNSGLAHNFMSQIYLSQARDQDALIALAKDNDPFWSLYRKSIVEYSIGDRKKADSYLSEFINKFGNEGWPNIAHVYAFRKENDQAFKWLNLAIENNDASILEILNYPEFKPLRNDPRWKALITKLKLPEHHGFFN